MNEDYHCIENTATVGEAIALLTEKDTSGLAIVDSDRKVVGFLSDGDIMKGLAKEERTFSDGVNLIALIDNKRIQEKAALLLAQNVMTIATKKPIVVEDTCPLQDAVKVLSDKRIKKMPVLQDGKMVGSLSRRDVVRVMARVNRLGKNEKPEATVASEMME